ncbi:hypothetical protein [uncultured Kordia sp.]|uniref:hypothetical protein n=1 Tax=uncultured Kordia sp. TaxID=507699 RepID=UPI002620F563|nr:hypothetical protein [uncultured Kordia sp.]
MKNFLENIQLIKHTQIKLPVNKSEFIRSFKQHVDEGHIGAFSSMFEAFSSSKNRYKGNITQNTFEIRRRREFFDRTSYLAHATGSFRQQNDHIVIDTEINGFSNFLIPFYVIITVFYLFFIFMIMTNVESSGILLVFIIFHAFLMYGIPYFVIKKRVKNTAIDLEKELFFMTQRNHNS